MLSFIKAGRITLLLTACYFISPICAEEPPVTQHTDRINDAIERGSDYLRALAAEDESGWFFPPRKNRRKIGTKQVEVRYTRKTVTRPVYEYENVEVYRNVREGDSVDAVTVRKKVTERRAVKQIGTREEERLVRDPNGSIVKMQNRAIFDQEGDEEWRAGQFGQNAMAAYALIKAGVDPADETVFQVIENLYNLYTDFGLPDWTWDVAWSAAAFSMYDDSRFRQMAEKLTARLLDGQIDSGAAAGLWGPVCIKRLLQNPSRRPPRAVATRGSVSENGESADVLVLPDV